MTKIFREQGIGWLAIRSLSASLVFSIGFVIWLSSERFLGVADAVSFNSDILASSTGVYAIGGRYNEWKSINNTIFFSASGTVGINVPSPVQKLDLGVRLRLNTLDAKPTCTSDIHGTIWYVQAKAGSPDELHFCRRHGDSTFGWQQIL